MGEDGYLATARWTHVALPVSDLDRSIDFYTALTPLVVVLRTEDDSGRGAWLSNDHQVASPFVLVLVEFKAAGRTATRRRHHARPLRPPRYRTAQQR